MRAAFQQVTGSGGLYEAKQILFLFTLGGQFELKGEDNLHGRYLPGRVYSPLLRCFEMTYLKREY